MTISVGDRIPDVKLMKAGEAGNEPVQAAEYFAGKQAGILGAMALARATGFAQLPAGANWLHLWGLAVLCGIGFTMSLFIATLALPGHPDLFEQARTGILGGSLASAVLGYALLTLARSRG